MERVTAFITISSLLIVKATHDPRESLGHRVCFCPNKSCRRTPYTEPISPSTAINRGSRGVEVTGSQALSEEIGPQQYIFRTYDQIPIRNMGPRIPIMPERIPPNINIPTGDSNISIENISNEPQFIPSEPLNYIPTVPQYERNEHQSNTRTTPQSISPSTTSTNIPQYSNELSRNLVPQYTSNEPNPSVSPESQRSATPIAQFLQTRHNSPGNLHRFTYELPETTTLTVPRTFLRSYPEPELFDPITRTVPNYYQLPGETVQIERNPPFETVIMQGPAHRGSFASARSSNNIVINGKTIDTSQTGQPVSAGSCFLGILDPAIC